MNAGRIKVLAGFTSLCLLCPAGYSAAHAGGVPDLVVTYLSPVPNSGYILPGSNIIIRTDHLIGTDASLHLIRSVTGTQSGAHRFAVRISDDGRTVTCKPGMPFAASEDVTVQVDTTTARWSGPAAAGGFTFSISGTPQTPAAIRQLTRAADYPPAVSAQGHSVKKGLAVAGGETILPNITVTVSGTTSPGSIFLAPIMSSVESVPALLIMQNDGTPVFVRDLQADAYDFKPQPNGNLTYYDNTISMFVEMDQTYRLIDTIQCGNDYLTDIHELRLLQNGHALLLGTDIQTVDMSRIVPGGYPQAQVVGSVIQELDTGKNVVFQWRTWDHFRITDAVGVDFTATSIDYAHSNAIDVDTDGNLLLSSRMQDEITKINRETGDIIWRLGGNNNQFRFVNDSIGFTYQHAVRRIANGDITLLDNGDLHVPPFSRAVEYALDTSKMTATLVWQYRHSPDILGFAMGFVERMDNGNTFIAWGAANPTVTEVTSAGTTVYEMTLDTGEWTYRAFRYVWPATSLPVQLASFNGNVASDGSVHLAWSTLTEENTYGFRVQRSGLTAEKYQTLVGSFIAGHGTTLQRHAYAYVDTPGSSGRWWYRLMQIDLDETSRFSDGISVDFSAGSVGGEMPTEFSLGQNYPNPFNPSTTIRYALPSRSNVTLTVSNIIGQQVATLVHGSEEQGYHEVKLDGLNLASGVYFYRLQAGSFVQSKKFVLLR
jgi:hypothetical protein